MEDVGSNVTSVAAVQFFSFAKLDNAIALLHPNWPENIFGKVSFFRSEFLLLPIIAFSPLLFLFRTKIKKKEHSTVLFFILLCR